MGDKPMLSMPCPACFQHSAVMWSRVELWQVQGREGHPRLYNTSWECARRMVAAEGVSSLWRGSLSTYMKVPSHIMMCSYWRGPGLTMHSCAYDWMSSCWTSSKCMPQVLPI